MILKGVLAKEIKDTRGENTISVCVRTSAGSFESSAPNGKSKGKFEAKSYKTSLKADVKILKNLFKKYKEIEFEEFSDLIEIEEICDGKIGANTLFALESAVLKALAKSEKKEVWQIINEDSKTIPAYVQNVIGGGRHSHSGKKPDFQEFLIISDNANKNLDVYNEIRIILKKRDEKFSEEKNDENAWQTSLNEKQILDLLCELRKVYKFDIGVDIAASEFYSRKKYLYKNPVLTRKIEEQRDYIKSLVTNASIFYVEDPFEEEDFESFNELRKSFPGTLIVGDDLTTTNLARLKRAINNNSISGIIIKPNQIGSLLEVKKVCELAKDNKIKIIFSHRSGETSENILADLAVGFEADYIKCGIGGKGRDEKIKRMEEIKEEIEEGR